MIYSPVFAGLEPDMKSRVLRRLRTALQPAVRDELTRSFTGAEKEAIQSILAATLTDWKQDG